MKFTSVVSYHSNPLTCGVAKFSAELAKRLGVPFLSIHQAARWGAHPLFSLKWSELRDQLDVDSDPIWSLEASLDRHRNNAFSVFWHDAGWPDLTRRATHVFYADPSLGSPGLWCPSLITPRKRPVRLFSFGMAHKLQTEKYKRVRELLDAASICYHLRVSVGLHEGTSLDGAEKHFDALKEIMGPENVTILGVLSDDAVAEELRDADYVLAFFEKGARANNTTVHAAHAAGCIVLTNFDADTPSAFYYMAIDLNCMGEWNPGRFDTPYTWDNLIQQMKGVCENSRSATA